MLHASISGLLALALLAQQPDDLAHDQHAGFEPRIVPASDEGRAALERFQVPEGFRVELVAAEPAFANPVAFWPARDGSFYVAETFRHHQGVTDIRDHMDWLDDDLAARTVEERVAYFKKQLGARFPEFEQAYERISLLRDIDGDGVCERSTVFSQAFTGAAAGIAAGVLENHGDVYVTCIPSLWRLRDTDGDDRADRQVQLLTGFGVHVALLGHDLHGLRIGPDGRLYFSIGDRGFDVWTQEGEIHHPQCGAVLRCELDGSQLEVFATGLRNPQELAFDAWGNLFTGDNNSDGGDRARLVQVVEGGDSGWRQSYQWITEPALRGPWNDEKLWQPHFEGQAAYIVPPIANFADGPSGLTIDPGTGFPEAYRGRLFLCDFRGDAGSSGVHSIELAPQGAGFALQSSAHLLWKVLATDCDFGPDGALYVTDWVQGWAQPGKGRLYRVYEPNSRGAPVAKATRQLLAHGVQGISVPELIGLLSFADQRVRQEAQLELARRGEPARAALEQTARAGTSLWARVHALWALGIQLRQHESASTEVLLALLADPEAELRAQAAHVLGDLRQARAAEGLVRALGDESARVRLYAALGLGRLRDPKAVPALLQLARATKDADPVLRYAAIRGLAGCASDATLAALLSDPDANARLAAVVALRRHAAPEIARFLADPEVLVRVEAARAIDEVPIAGASAALAEVLSARELGSYDLARRAINATFREGRRPKLLADFALRAEQDERARREALDRLTQWKDPPSRDPISSAWKPFGAEELAARRALDLQPIVLGLAEGGIAKAPESVVVGWLKLVAAHSVAAAAPSIEPLLASPHPSGVRCAALRALAAVGTPRLREHVQVALADSDGELRAIALEALTKIAPADARPLAERVLIDGELRERRTACRLLGALADPAATPALGAQLDKLLAGLFPVELSFDLVSAARARKDSGLDAKLAALERSRALDPTLAPWIETLFGGQQEAGKSVFREKSETSCLRCHKTEWDEGGNVGPDLRGLGKRLSRLQILESILQPNRHVDPVYRNTLFALQDERVVEARILLEDQTKFRVLDANARTFDLSKSEVESHRDGLSAMPEGLEKFLTPREMRDLIEYLCSI